MPVYRYNVTMNDDLPAGLVTAFGRGGLVNGDQAAVNTVTVHDTHDFTVGHKFLYALSRTNILTNRVFTVSGVATTTVTFSGDPFTFTDKNHLVPLGAETGGVLQADGTYSALNWDGSPITLTKDQHADSAYSLATVPIEPGGELGFWSETQDIWAISRSTGGKPFRVYILSVPTIVEAVTNVQIPAATVLGDAYAWYKADSITNLADGANMVTWQDLSGNARHLTAHGCTATNAAQDSNAKRPHWNAVGTTKGMTNLPSVSLEGDTAGAASLGYFTIDTGTFSLDNTAGWTVCFILKHYTDAFVNRSNILANDVVLGDDANDIIAMAGGGVAVVTSFMAMQTGGTDAFFGNAYAHLSGAETEAHVLRSSASAGALRQWLDGALVASTGSGGGPYLRPQLSVFRYIGRQVVTAGNVVAAYGVSLAELIIYDRALTDTEVGLVNTYLLDRLATAQGALTGQGIPRNIGTWPNTTATSGDDTACTNGTAYCGSIFVPGNVVVAGIQYLVGSVGGTDKVIASLHDSTGALLIHSTLAGTTVGTTAQLQQVAFLAPIALTGPAWYFLALTFNGATAKFRSVPAFCNAGNGVIGNGVTQTFGTAASFTAPTTFTANKVPVASVY